MSKKEQVWKTYVGSVRFYRHIIIGVFLTVLLSSVILNLIFLFFYFYKETPTIVEPQPVKQAFSAQSNIGNSHNLINQDFTYSSLYSELIVEGGVDPIIDNDTIYLTFDDGPSQYTTQVLDILKKYDVKATFFVVGSQITKDNEHIIKRISDESHSLGIHTNSHDYNKIYYSVEKYLDDFYEVSKKVFNIVGYYPEIFRFPGGSVNNFNGHIYKQIIAEMTRRGFVYFDWNVSSGDASSTISTESIKRNVIEGVKNNNRSIVLLHDSKLKTSESLEFIIKELKKTGYAFDTLSRKVKAICFPYSK